MAQQVNLGLMVPAASTSLPEPDAFRRFVQEAEALGFHSLWGFDRVFHRLNVLDCLTTLTWAAAYTRRMRLGTGVLLFAYRNAVLVAKAVATLDYLSGGRLTLGISLGGQDAEYQGIGVPVKERVARLREGLDVMRRLWREDKVTYQGRFHNLQGVSLNPKPVQRPSIPIWMGGRNEAVLRRTGELADGWMLGSGGAPADFAGMAGRVQGYAKDRGRDPSAMEFGKLLYVSIDQDRERARQAAKAYLNTYYGESFDVDRSAIFGPPDACAARIREYAQAGVPNTTLVLGPTTLDLDHLRRLADAALPLARTQ